jgi:hypothetical protein
MMAVRLPYVRALVALLAVVGVAAGLLGGAAWRVEAQEPPEDSSPLTIDVQLTPPTIRLGERTDLVISVQHPSDLLLTVRPPQTGEAVRLIAESGPREVLFGDTTFTTFTFTFAAFELATHPIEAIEVSWLRSDGATGSERLSLPAIEVVPIREATDLTLRPLKPQATILGGPAGWVGPATIAAIAAISLVVLSAGGFWMWRRRGREARPVVVVPDVGAEQRARQRLDRASAVGPRGGGGADYEHYYGELAGAVREYLTARFEFNAAALTTTELEARMTEQGVGRWQARLVSGLLDRCDAAVFARRIPDPTSADHDLTVAFEIIELSRPRTQTAAELDAEEPVPV